MQYRIKFYLLFFISFLASQIVFSQQKSDLALFSYQFTLNFQGSPIYSLTQDLFFKDGKSIYVTYSKDFNSSVDSKQVNNASFEMESNSYSKNIVLFKNYKSGEMILNTLTADQKVCIVNDSVPVLDWIITKETKQIGRFKCQKAITSYRCAEFSAWFTSEIPLSIGPDKLSGLPGLIVEATNHRSDGIYRLISFESPSNKKINIEPPSDEKLKKYSYKEYVNFQLQQQKEQKAFKRAQLDDGEEDGSFEITPECLIVK